MWWMDFHKNSWFNFEINLKHSQADSWFPSFNKHIMELSKLSKTHQMGFGNIINNTTERWHFQTFTTKHNFKSINIIERSLILANIQHQCFPTFFVLTPTSKTNAKHRWKDYYCTQGTTYSPQLLLKTPQLKLTTITLHSLSS